MNVLTTGSGAPGEQLALLTQQGDAFLAQLADPAAIADTTTPLSSVLFVDGGNTGAATPNGSIGAPFRTIQAAIDAASDSLSICTSIYIAPGTYADAVNAGSKFVALIGLVVPSEDRGVLINNTVNANTDLFLQNLILAGAVTCTALTMLDCQMSEADISGANAVISSSTNGNNTFFSLVNVTMSGGLTLTRMNLQGNVEADAILIDGCVFEAVAQTITANSSASGTDICTVLNSRKSEAGNVVTFVCSVEGGNLAVDTFSNQYMNNNVATTFTLIRVLGALAEETISVTVPAVAAGNVGYANVTAVAGLKGITTADVVDGNPTEDLVTAGAGGGYINCRVSGNDTIRCAFVGPLAGGASNFRFVRLTRSALP